MRKEKEKEKEVEFLEDVGKDLDPIQPSSSTLVCSMSTKPGNKAA